MPGGQQQRPVVVQVYAKQHGDRLIVGVGMGERAIAAAGFAWMTGVVHPRPQTLVCDSLPPLPATLRKASSK